jgi:ATP-dependent DNA helicase DinG
MVLAADILGPGGRIAARLKNYERRPEQLAMSEAVERAIHQRRHLVVEAGTGVGKSFAYLVPAILATAEQDADDSRRRVVISTHTISLQEQLLHKDIPFLRSVTPWEFTAVLVKGRQNYLSRRRLQNALARATHLFSDDEEFAQLRRLADWAKTTSDGTLSDLDFRPAASVWEEVSSDHGNCMGRECPHYADCFYYQARRRMNHAQILVVNHALFFSDLALRIEGASILPDHQVVILDEAHTIEAVAGEHLGLRVTSGQVEHVLRKLYHQRSNRGLLVHHRMGDAQRAVIDCRRRAELFFGALAEWLDAQQGGNGRVRQRKIVPNPLGEGIVRLAALIRGRAEKLKKREMRQDLLAAADRLTALAGEIDDWLNQRLPDTVYWVENTTSRSQQRRIALAAAPIEIGPLLRQHLFEQVPTVVMTSATLSVAGRFEFFKARVGLTQAETLALGSPFDYQRQAQLVLLDGMPDPNSESEQYEQRVVAMIRRYVERSGGRAFVLFTSYEMMGRAAAALGHWLAENNLALL